MEFITIISIRSKYKHFLALLTKKSCSSFKRMLKTKGGTAINSNVRDKSGLLAIRNPNTKLKTKSTNRRSKNPRSK